MPKINKIKLSGTSYDIQDSNASKTVTLTQAQYDALQTKDPNTFYIISDGETFDPSEKVDTSAFTAYSASVETALSGKAAQGDLNTLSGTVTGHTGDTTIHVTASEKATWNAKSDFSGSYNDLTNKLSAGTNISIVDNVISAEGGGKAISAGTNISVTTGETADTINCTLNAKNGTGAGSIIFGNMNNISSDQFSVAFGSGTQANGIASIAEGQSTQTTAWYCHSSGYKTLASGKWSNAEGYQTTASTKYSHTEGIGTKVTNDGEHSQGMYNTSSSDGTTSGNTLFSVGNGTANNARHNAFEIRQNGDIYLTFNGQDVKLQDQLGGSSYTAGRGIDITNDTISFSLPISAGTGTNSIIENYTSNVASGSYSHAEGRGTTAGTGSYTHAEGYNTKASGSYSHAEGASSLASGSYTHAEGSNTKASGQYSHAEGYYTTASTDYTHAEGYNTKASGRYSHAEGSFTTAQNEAEHASGQYNVSSSASTTFGDSGNTLFSVGNGTNSARHNAFEIRQNGDIYLNDGSKLQDTVSATAANTTALGGLSLVKLSQSEYDALATKDSNTLYVING